MLNENANLFWERVKNLIKQQNTTQEWIAQQCEVSLGMVKSWIFNKRLPDAAQATRIAKALSTSVEFLATGEDKNPLVEENAQLKTRLGRIADIATGRD